LTPDHGQFVAQRLAASASTLLVIDSVGRMFTRLADYETFVGTPGLRSTYRPGARACDPNRSDSFYQCYRTLPIPDWRPQSPIPLSGQAVVTTDISIVLTGHGNAARELRVQGRDSGGHYGYYSKPIYGETWSFEETGELFDEKDVIQNYGGTPVAGPKLDKTYSGSLSQPGAPDLEVELIDFNYFDSPTALRVRTQGRVFDLQLHTVDAYSATTQGPLDRKLVLDAGILKSGGSTEAQESTLESERRDADLVGSFFGEPKLLKGTLIVPAEVRASADPVIRQTLATYFDRFDYETFAIEIAANDRQVAFDTQSYLYTTRGYMAYRYFVPLTGILRNASLPSPEETLAGYGYLVTEPVLVVDDPEQVGPSELTHLRKAIVLNERMLEGIRKLHEEERRIYASNGLFNGLSTVLWYGVICPIANLAGLPSLNMIAGNVAEAGGGILSRYAKIDIPRSFSDPTDYENSKKLLESRIKLYREQIPRLEGMRERRKSG
jgi:hypothetical protein